MKHISVDTETWGTEPGAFVRSIGAVVFDEDGTAYANGGRTTSLFLTDRAFYVALRFEDMPGLHKNPSTVEWWDGKGAAAVWPFGSEVAALVGLTEFALWLKGIGDPADVRLWFKGCHFDEPILRAMYKAYGLPVPWHYRAPRDHRTIMEAAGLNPVTDCHEFGLAHHAYHDAVAQAFDIVKAWRLLRGVSFVNPALPVVEL
jgi:hypothetical protein